MKTYIEYKSEISAFNDVLETVKTTEKVAASYIHILKQEVKNLEEYTSEIENLMARFSLFYTPEQEPLFTKTKTKEKGVIVIAGDNGLVGSLYHNLITFFLAQEKKYNYDFVIVFGQKGRKYLEQEKIKVEYSFALPAAHFIDQDVQNMTKYVFSEFEKKNFPKIDIVYSKFLSLAQQEPVLLPFLPFDFERRRKEILANQNNNERESTNSGTGKEGLPQILANQSLGLPIFEPKKAKIFDWFLQKYVEIFFYRIIMEAKLSEFSARTVAMEQASKNTEKMIHDLMLTYFKQRRRIITQRQLESFSVHKLL